MKRIILYLLILVLTFSCASKGKYPYDDVIKSEHTTVYDFVKDKVHMVKSYPDAHMKYQQWIAEGRINQDARISCFDNSESVNYVTMAYNQVVILRNYAAKQDLQTNYRAVSGNLDGAYLSVNYQTESSNLKVKRETCFRKIDGKSYYIQSEIYY